MNNFYSLLIFTFVLLDFNIGSGQTTIIVSGQIMPSALTSTENFYFEYFGKKKTQPTIHFGGRIGLEIKGRWILFTGFNFHSRKMSTDCLFIPQEGIHPIIQGTIPQTSSSICTHTTDRDYSIIDIPILVGYKIKNNKKVKPYFLLGFSPFKKLKYAETRTNIDTGEITRHNRSYSSELYYLFFANLSVGADYGISPKFNISSEVVYKVDDKTFRDQTIGLSFGLNYIINP